MPLISTRGAASAQGFGEFAKSAGPVYIEDVFSTYLYTGNGSTQAITNGIDLSGKGGLVWMKGRSDATDHALYDTTRGATKDLVSNSTAAETTQSTGLTAFSGTGFSIGALAKLNTNAATYASWTFRKQAKFFDVVTWTGDNVNGRVIPHSLNAEVGFIAVKAITTSANDNNWVCRHRSQTSPDRLYLNTTGAASGSTNLAPTTTGFTVYANGYNETGVQYVAYLFAHNAGGFGLTGSDNVISCGSFTTDASGNFSVNLGYEAQWVLVKSTDFVDSWYLIDVMRGMSQTSTNTLKPNTSGAETAYTQGYCVPTATGFASVAPGLFTGSKNFIYIAIRRGPMKVPTSGTEVYNAIARTGTSAAATVTAGFPVDMVAVHMRNSANNEYVADRLRGGGLSLEFCATAGETDRSAGGITSLGSNTGFSVGIYSDVNSSPNTYINWCFRRAPGFFDVVCYTGTGSAVAQNHNLSAVPELVIVKKRTAPGYGQDWYVRAPTCVANGDGLILNSTAAQTSSSAKIYSLTSTTFTVQNEAAQNTDTYVAYLFATVAGISKVGSYTGNGSSQTINCGFTGGARFVLIKRTDSTGDWYVWDSARGIVAGNDPRLSLNSTAAEVTTDDSVDADNTGFIVNQLAATNINVSSATYIFLAIA